MPASTSPPGTPEIPRTISPRARLSSLAASKFGVRGYTRARALHRTRARRRRCRSGGGAARWGEKGKRQLGGRRRPLSRAAISAWAASVRVCACRSAGSAREQCSAASAGVCGRRELCGSGSAEPTGPPRGSADAAEEHAAAPHRWTDSVRPRGSCPRQANPRCDGIPLWTEFLAAVVSRAALDLWSTGISAVATFGEGLGRFTRGGHC